MAEKDPKPPNPNEVRSSLFDQIAASQAQNGAGLELPSQVRSRAGFFVIVGTCLVILMGVGFTLFRTFQQTKLQEQAKLESQAEAPSTTTPNRLQGWESQQGRKADDKQRAKTDPQAAGIGIIIKDPKEGDPDPTKDVDTTGMTPEQQKAYERLHHGENPNEPEPREAHASEPRHSDGGSGRAPAPVKVHHFVIDTSGSESAPPAVSPAVTPPVLPAAEDPQSQNKVAAWMKEHRPTSTPEKPPTPTVSAGQPQTFAEWDQADPGAQTYRVFKNSLLTTRLLNQTTASSQGGGPIICQVIKDFYSFNLQKVLIPKGSIVSGEIKTISALNQERAFVVFDTLLYPDGYVVSLLGNNKTFLGLDVEGQPGLRGQVNHHYLSTFGYALALSALSVAANAGNVSAYGGYGGYDWQVQMRSQGASQLGQRAEQIFAQKLQQAPTFTLRAAEVVMVWFPTSDLLLHDYEHHRMPLNL